MVVFEILVKKTVSFLAFSRAKLVDSRNNCGNVFFFLGSQKNSFHVYIERCTVPVLRSLHTSHVMSKKSSFI